MKFKNTIEVIGNRGSAVVEATLILPLFIFGILAVYQMGQSRLAECDIYEAAAETVEYMAEYSYIGECNLLIPEIKFREYIDDSERINRYISNGTDGIDFWGSIMLDEDGYVMLQVNYKVVVSLPLMPELFVERSVCVKQRAYVGENIEQESGSESTDDMYVYVTDNRDVYHTTRSCSHLRLSISMSNRQTARAGGYTECGFCGNMEAERVYITDEGNRYHYNINCSGLKRTVYRIQRSAVGNIGGCQRCVGSGG